MERNQILHFSKTCSIPCVIVHPLIMVILQPIPIILQILLIIALPPTDKEEIANIICTLNSNKASGPSSIPYRVLFLLKNENLKQLADLSNLSFMTGVFPFVLKTAKVSKLDYRNYCPISPLSNIEKIHEKIM